MKKSFPLLLLIFLFGPSYAQPDCTAGQFKERIHANNISAELSVSGGLFRDGLSSGAFNVPFDPLYNLSTVFTSGLCIVGKDSNDSLKGCAMLYGLYNDRSDFWPGPLSNTGETTSENCENWDRLWKVDKYQIVSHIADFTANGFVDNPIDDIYKWPGAGNPHFESLNGFSLPDLPQGYAPFWDQNGDGIYNPTFGDYPIAPKTNHEVIPEQLFWGVFNDAGNVHTDLLGGKAIGMEIHLSVWAFACESEHDLNNSLFVSYKMINRSEEELKDARAGLYVDFDMGCFTDDFVGSIPEKNTFYVYNSDEMDGDEQDQGGPYCVLNIPIYDGGVPTQSVTLLDGDLDYFGVANFSTFAPEIQHEPKTLEGLNNVMNGRWRDGLPFTEGGTGYDTLQLTPSTNHLFDGNPNDPEAWSMFAENLQRPWSDFAGLGSTIIPDLNPGQSTELTYVFTFFADEGNDYLQNVQSIYDRVDFLQLGFDQGMINVCDYQEVCSENCLWPGDTNEDGTANHFDLLPIMTNIGSNGPARLNFPTWAPKFAENWAQDGFKHFDADGDGIINVEDLFISNQHYDLTNLVYEEPDAFYPVGDHVYVDLGLAADINDLAYGQLFSINVKLRNVENLHALAYTLEYDSTFYSIWTPSTNLTNLTLDDQKVSLGRFNADAGELDYAAGKIADSWSFEGEVINTIIVRINPDLANQVLESNQTQIRFRNLIGVDVDGNDLNIGAEDVFLTVPEITVSAQEIELEGLKIFPNPTSGIVTVESPNEIIDQVFIYDISGREVDSYFIETHRKELNLTHLSKGMYFLELTTTNGKYTSKLILN